jgi:hypothetical protein
MEAAVEVPEAHPSGVAVDPEMIEATEEESGSYLTSMMLFMAFVAGAFFCNKKEEPQYVYKGA